MNGHASGRQDATAMPAISAADATWRNMPHKKQVAILALSRLVDFFQQAALQTYGYYQLRSFNPSITEADLAHQTGLLFASFTFSQIVSSFLWGVAADRPTVGRKLVLQIGLIGTAFGCVGVAFSTSFQQAVFWRFFCGAINGCVGSARTMLGETVPRAWHSRAFLLFPAAFNIANVLGPLLSGILSEYSHAQQQMPAGQVLSWYERYPYAAPNLLCTILLLSEATLVHLHLQETLAGKIPFSFEHFSFADSVRSLLSPIRVPQWPQRSSSRDQQGLLTGQADDDEEHSDTTAPKAGIATSSTTLPLSSIFTRNVFCVLISIAIFDFHLGAFNNLWVLLLTAAREYVPASAKTESLPPRSAFKFTTGLAFTPARVGTALAIIGYIGVTLQFLLYPPASKRFGLLRCFRASLFLFPVAYYLAPFIAQLPSTSPPPEPAAGMAVWSGIAIVIFLQVAARTFAMPATLILLNNASPHSSVLGTVNGLGQACSATFRTVGPYVSSIWFNIWRERGVIGMSWWIVAAIASLGCIASFWVNDGQSDQLAPPKPVALQDMNGGARHGDSRV